MISLTEKELVAKGFANHYRIRILELLHRNTKPLSLEEIVENLDAQYKTISVHLQKLHRAKLVEKKYLARNVLHTITKRGDYGLTFLRKLE